MALWLFAALSAACGDSAPAVRREADSAGTGGGAERRRVLLVNSYHPGYAWSDGITESIAAGFGAVLREDGSVDRAPGDVDFDVVYMDTKRRTEEEAKRSAARDVMRRIDEWQPDLVITADDNAAKYVVAANRLFGRVPVVFCGLDADPADYRFPCPNLTGIRETEPLELAVNAARPHAAGDRLGYLAQDGLTAHRNLTAFEERLGATITSRFVTTLAAWRGALDELQSEVDVLILGNVTGIADMDLAAAVDHAVRRTRIPTCSLSTAMAPSTLVTVGNVPSEQGEWVVAAARRILSGEPPEAIPIAASKRGRMVLNMRIAKRLGVRFPLSVIDGATLIGEEED